MAVVLDLDHPTGAILGFVELEVFGVHDGDGGAVRPPTASTPSSVRSSPERASPETRLGSPRKTATSGLAGRR